MNIRGRAKYGFKSWVFGVANFVAELDDFESQLLWDRNQINRLIFEKDFVSIISKNLKILKNVKISTFFDFIQLEF